MKKYYNRLGWFCFVLLFCLAGGINIARAGPYLDSSHGSSTTGVDRSSIDSKFSTYSVGNCAHCHLQHASLTDASTHSSYTAQNDLLSNANNLTGYQFCTECHDANGPATDDIASLYGLTYGHGITGNEVNCTECHNPHQAQAPTIGTSRGNDATTGSIKGVSGVDVAAWPIPGTPAGGNEILASPSFTPIDPITKEWQLCLKCHGGQVTGLTNIAAQINPNNYSAHPVAETSWHNPNLIANPGWLKPPFNVANQPIYCSDCHGSDETTTDPKGPHGSNIVYMLREIGSTEGGSPNDVNSYDDLCRICHLTNNSNSNFGNHTSGAHPYGGANLLGCTACHGSPRGNFGGRLGNIHGTNYKWADVSGDAGLTSARFLVGGYNIELYYSSKGKGSNNCAADEAVAQTGVGSCSMGAHSFP